MGRAHGDWRIDQSSARLMQRIVCFHSDVDFGVTTHLLAPLGREVENTADGLDVVGVHVEDRAAEGLAQVRRVAGGARLVRVGGEADLVVAHDVDGAA